MAYKFKSDQVIIEGNYNCITPKALPSDPYHGCFAVDEIDKKFKVWNGILNRWITLGDATDQFFNNLTNGFTSTNTQSAIEEAKNSSIGAIYTLTFLRQGSAGNAWMYVGDSGTTTDESPAPIPFNCKLVSVTASNNSSARNYDIRVNISNPGEGTTINRTIIYQVRNSRTYTKTDFQTSDNNLNITAGSKISVYIQNQGASPTDLIVSLGFKVTNESNVTTTETFSSNITISLGPITIILG